VGAEHRLTEPVRKEIRVGPGCRRGIPWCGRVDRVRGHDTVGQVGFVTLWAGRSAIQVALNLWESRAWKMARFFLFMATNKYSRIFVYSVRAGASVTRISLLEGHAWLLRLPNASGWRKKITGTALFFLREWDKLLHGEFTAKPKRSVSQNCDVDARGRIAIPCGRFLGGSRLRHHLFCRRFRRDPREAKIPRTLYTRHQLCLPFQVNRVFVTNE
jgi:hypothetical protein